MTDFGRAIENAANRVVRGAVNEVGRGVERRVRDEVRDVMRGDRIGGRDRARDFEIRRDERGFTDPRFDVGREPGPGRGGDERLAMGGPGGPGAGAGRDVEPEVDYKSPHPDQLRPGEIGKLHPGQLGALIPEHVQHISVEALQELSAEQFRALYQDGRKGELIKSLGYDKVAPIAIIALQEQGLTADKLTTDIASQPFIAYDRLKQGEFTKLGADIAKIPADMLALIAENRPDLVAQMSPDQIEALTKDQVEVFLADPNRLFTLGVSQIDGILARAGADGLDLSDKQTSNLRTAQLLLKEEAAALSTGVPATELAKSGTFVVTNRAQAEEIRIQIPGADGGVETVRRKMGVLAARPRDFGLEGADYLNDTIRAIQTRNLLLLKSSDIMKKAGITPDVNNPVDVRTLELTDLQRDQLINIVDQLQGIDQFLSPQRINNLGRSGLLREVRPDMRPEYHGALGIAVPSPEAAAKKAAELRAETIKNYSEYTK